MFQYGSTSWQDVLNSDCFWLVYCGQVCVQINPVYWLIMYISWQPIHQDDVWSTIIIIKWLLLVRCRSVQVHIITKCSPRWLQWNVLSWSSLGRDKSRTLAICFCFRSNHSSGRSVVNHHCNHRIVASRMYINTGPYHDQLFSTVIANYCSFVVKCVSGHFQHHGQLCVG